MLSIFVLYVPLIVMVVVFKKHPGLAFFGIVAISLAAGV